MSSRLVCVHTASAVSSEQSSSHPIAAGGSCTRWVFFHSVNKGCGQSPQRRQISEHSASICAAQIRSKPQQRLGFAWLVLLLTALSGQRALLSQLINLLRNEHQLTEEAQLALNGSRRATASSGALEPRWRAHSCTVLIYYAFNSNIEGGQSVEIKMNVCLCAQNEAAASRWQPFSSITQA